MNIWVLRVVWIVTPALTGPAIAASTRNWDTPVRVTAEILLWIAWAAVLVGLVIPRPLGLTALRIVGTSFATTAVVIAVGGRPSALAIATALGATLGALALGGTSSSLRTFAQGTAYGDELRFPLRIPPALFLGILPVALVAIGAGAAAGPLLLAAGEIAAGVVALVVGVPVAALLARSVHQLALRWAVIVPAGFVIADPMTLADPILIPREHVASIAPLDARQRPPARVRDLRLGAARGSIEVRFDSPADLPRRVRGRVEVESSAAVAIATVASREMLDAAGRRRLPVHHDLPA